MEVGYKNARQMYAEKQAALRMTKVLRWAANDPDGQTALPGPDGGSADMKAAAAELVSRGLLVDFGDGHYGITIEGRKMAALR